MKILRLWIVTLLLSSFLFLPIGIASDVPFADVPFDVNNIPEPVPPPKEVRDFFDLDPFYQQWINIKGFPVLASANVSPYALKETAWEIGQIIGHRSDILNALAKNRIRYTIIAHNELATDVPELRPHLIPHFYYNVRQRGGACWYYCRTIFGAEEFALRNAGSDVATHEMAHGIHEIVNLEIDPTFDNRLETVYNAAMDKGLWQGSFLAINRWEYWAEGVTTWFHANLHSPIKTRDALKAYDPALALLIAEVFGDYDWRSTPIRMRTHLPHLEGFDPQSAPWREFPPGVEEAYEELRDPAIEERSEWVNLPPYAPSMLPRLNELRNRNLEGDSPMGWTDLLVVNTIEAEVLFYWVNPDGTETLHYRFPPNPWLIAHFTSRVGDLLLAKDSTGKNLAVFQAAEKTGRAFVGPVLHLVTPGLSKISGDNQAGVSGMVLANPFVIQVRDQNLSILEGISVVFTVTAGNGTLSVASSTTDKNGRAESTLTLGPNQGTNTVSVSATGIEGTIIFNAVAEAATNIPDPNLRAAVETALSKTAGDSITSSEMETLTRLEAQNANISDLTGLEFATKLTHLYLPENSISDISPLAGLASLTSLSLWDNSIADISTVKGLINLTELSLGGNSVRDISPIADLTNLTGLHLPGNRIADISAVAGLTQLTWLYLGGTNITDLSFLSGLTNLKTLGFEYNSISDLSPLVANTGLGKGDTVYVQGNPLSYHSIHTHIPTLQSRGVTVEFDADGTRPPDVNNDGSVNVLDLVSIASEIGNTGPNLVADVNRDRVVSILDLILVAGMFGNTVAAPSASAQVPETLTTVEVQEWLTDARLLEIKDYTMKRGIMVLEQLLISLTPTETELLANYPNPFNPETWIPYRLAEDAFVTLTVYDMKGQVVRTLDVGHRIASAYESRSKAIYWDGRNGLGEPVASGVYFYTLTAGDFSATRRMLILK